MPLDLKEKELVSVGASLASGCKICTSFHLREVRKAGASDEEIERAMSDAMAVRDSARDIMERHGLKLLGHNLQGGGEENGDGEDDAQDTTRIRELVSIGAAFAVNCTSNLKKHLRTAREIGISEEEIESVIDTARFIKGKADSLCCKVI